MERQERVLLDWYTEPTYIPPFRLSGNQITVGPEAAPDSSTEGYAAITPPGVYDLKATLEAQGLECEPDLLVVWSDASGTNLPMNLDAFRCPKVLGVGDTHHMKQPLQRMVQYARKAGFDFVVSSYNRQHLHWFSEAGVSNVAWLPGLPVQRLPRPLDYQRKQRLAFIGQAGRFHPRRLRLLQEMERAQLPIQARRADHEAAAEAFARSVLSFNASLNGDLNLRIFEVLSAGGCLLTDRLAAESGLSEILEEMSA